VHLLFLSYSFLRFGYDCVLKNSLQGNYLTVNYFQIYRRIDIMSSSNKTEQVTYEMRGDVALVGLNRPEKRNAISDRFVREIEVNIRRARDEASAAVLFGHGDHFCAGLDLAEHVKKTPMQGVEGSRKWHDVFSQIEFGPIPWVAALHGAVVGGGLELAASVQVRVADETTFFALPEGQRGIFVGGGGSVRIARLTGVARMTDMMLMGRSVDAATAERWNIVQYIVPKGEALESAIKLAERAATNSTFSNYAVINALPRINQMGADDGLFVESFVSSFSATTPEAEARLNDFVQRGAGKVKAPGQ
jgi:(methylthio)acryloyl-CoA hydratase